MWFGLKFNIGVRENFAVELQSHFQARQQLQAQEPLTLIAYSKLYFGLPEKTDFLMFPTSLYIKKNVFLSGCMHSFLKFAKKKSIFD